MAKGTKNRGRNIWEGRKVIFLENLEREHLGREENSEILYQKVQKEHLGRKVQSFHTHKT